MKRYVNKKYLKYIESQPCLVSHHCQGDVVAHHTKSGGVGTKCSDHLTVPLCFTHHAHLHNGGHKTFQQVHRLYFVEEELRLMRGYYEEET